MPVDINGFQLTNSSGLGIGSTAKVSAGGFLQSNATPMMFGARTDTGLIASYPWVVNATTVNTGAWTSNTTWTCPVAGIYCICITLISGTGSVGSYGYNAVIINGALAYYGYYNVGDVWDTFTFRVLYKLALNDTVRWAANTAPGPVGNGSGSYGSNHNMASIWLVG
jgi:hypothetical protein